MVAEGRNYWSSMSFCNLESHERFEGGEEGTGERKETGRRRSLIFDLLPLTGVLLHGERGFRRYQSKSDHC